MRLRKQKENQAYQRLEEELGKAEINEDKLQDALEIIQNLQEKSQIRRNITQLMQTLHAIYWLP